MSIESIREALNKIEIPKGVKLPEPEFEDLLEQAEEKTKDEFDKIWTLLFGDKKKYEQFLLDYEADKLNQLKKYLEFLKMERE